MQSGKSQFNMRPEVSLVDGDERRQCCTAHPLALSAQTHGDQLARRGNGRCVRPRSVARVFTIRRVSPFVGTAFDARGPFNPLLACNASSSAPFAAATGVIAALTPHSRPQKGVEHSAVHRGGSAVAGGLAAANEL
jgi:hypothetical protein